jgi:hypothetical protein
LDTGTGCLINKTSGGDGGSTGRIFSDETRDKIRKSKLGIKRPKEVCEILSKTHKGKIMSDEAKKSISKKNKGKTPWNKGKSAWNKGIPMSDAAKQKLSESRKELFKTKNG